MSRSYRKAWVVDGDGSKWKKFMKNYANRRIRRNTEEVQDGMAYRKFTDQWSICDYRYQIDEKAEWFKERPWKYNRK